MLKLFLLTVFVCFVRADDPNRLPTKCETCKYMANELSEALLEHNSHDYIATNYNLDDRINKKNAKRYSDSEVRLIEVLEDVCERILKYNVHAEREGSLRYSKGESQTMQSLKELRDRGVKVELGIPEDLWDVPSAEITNLKKYCDQMVENYEEDIETWYLKHKHTLPLRTYLCEQRILVGQDTSCLKEEFKPEDKKKPKKKESKEDKPKTNQDKVKDKSDL